MTSQPDLKTITIYILPNIPRSKGNKTMKFFIKNHAENKAARLVPDLFVF